MLAPPSTDTWYPIRHYDVLEAVEETLDSASVGIKSCQCSVSKEAKRFFGTLDLQSDLAEGVSLSVGIRNSNHKSFPIGFCIGNRTFVCDNLAFSSEIVISKRHTRFGENRFREGIADVVAKLRYAIINSSKQTVLARTRDQGFVRALFRGRARFFDRVVDGRDRFNAVTEHDWLACEFSSKFTTYLCHIQLGNRLVITRLEISIESRPVRGAQILLTLVGFSLVFACHFAPSGETNGFETLDPLSGSSRP